ncbi:MAG TPA: hypothetical protein VFE66_08065 [Bacteroidales bacterium]|nr:hypothetical protein [Bacteroidales bacterium]
MNFIKFDLSSIQTRGVRNGLLLDIVAIAVVFFTPKIGQLIHLPFYMVEPMRLMVVLSIAHSNRANSYLLALTLPLFSWAVSGHPEFFKMLVMTGEMAANVFLFYYFVRKIDSVLLSMIISIVVSKVLCYAFYLVFFSMMFIQEEADPSFLIAQVITTLVFSFYVFFILRKKSQ